MANISELFPEYIFKYGATGVLAVWLFTMQMRLSDVEARLYDCLGSKKAMVECPLPDAPQQQLAILPKNDLKIKKYV